MQINGYAFQCEGLSNRVRTELMDGEDEPDLTDLLEEVLSRPNDDWEIVCATVEIERELGTRMIDGSLMTMYLGKDGEVYACSLGAIRETSG